MSNTDKATAIQYVVINDDGIAIIAQHRSHVFFDGFTDFSEIEDEVRELEENIDGELVVMFPEAQLTEEEVNELAAPYIDAFDGQQVILNFTERELEFVRPNRQVALETELQTLMFDQMDASESFIELLLMLTESIGWDKQFDFGEKTVETDDFTLDDGEKLPF